MLKLNLLGATALLSLGLALITFTVVGCGGNDTKTAPEPGVEADHADDEHEGDDHDHDEHEGDEHDHHDHEMGAHGGHMLHLNPGGAHAEWVHLDEDNELQIFLDESVLPVESVEMHVAIGGEEQDPYTFESAEEDLGEGAFRLTSEQLMTHVTMSAGEGVEVELVVTRDGETLTAPIRHHEH